jgi:hypothetical protein
MLSALNDPDGNPSTIRYINAFAFLIVLCAWCFLSIRHDSMLPIPESIVTLLGLLITGKVGQSIFAENKLYQERK